MGSTSSSSLSQETLKTPSPLVLWSWKSNDNPWLTSEPDQWTQYNQTENTIIEQAFQKKKDQIQFGDYYINFKTMTQVNRQDQTKQRPIKREAGNLREDRFLPPPPAFVKPLHSFQRGFCTFIDNWEVKVWARNKLAVDTDGKTITKDQPHQFLLNIVEEAAQGIITEGKAIGQEAMAESLANQLRETAKNNPEDICKQCVSFYTQECFLYKIINQALREENMTKEITLGAFCYLLELFCQQGTKTTSKFNYNKLVYRGCNLSQKQIDAFMNQGTQLFHWYAFTSISKNKSKAEGFGNVLFIISLIDEEGKIPEGQEDNGYSGEEFNGADISKLSVFPNEEEVLLPPSTIYKILKIEKQPQNKYHVYLSIYRFPGYC